MKPWSGPRARFTQTYSPPCSGYLRESSITAAAKGTKNRSQARSQSEIEGTPARALREIDRKPTTAMTFMRTTSRRPRTRRNPPEEDWLKARDSAEPRGAGGRKDNGPTDAPCFGRPHLP